MSYHTTAMILTSRMNSLLLGSVLALAGALLTTATLAIAQTPTVDGVRLSVGAEYLRWWIKDGPASPPLLSTGVLGDPDFSVVFGGRPSDTGAHQGARFTVGYRLTTDWALEGIGFFLPATSATRTVSSSGAPGSPRLVAPVFQVDQSREWRLTIARPDEFRGDARESLTTDMHGVELHVTRRIITADRWRLDALGGFRYLRLSERLRFSTNSVALDVPDVFQTTDVFDATNRFYGAQVGVKGEYIRGPWFAQGTAKVAMGVMRESLDITGTLLTNDFNDLGAPQTFVGGIFAQPTSVGRHDRDRLALVPEVGMKIGYRLTSWTSVFVGYTFLYASAVVRPGGQIDRNINTTQAMAFQAPQSPPPSLTLEGPAQPAVRFRESDFWVQGLNVGVSFSY
jgi:hypothetical protein